MFLRKVHTQCGGKILHTCLGPLTHIQPLSVQEHLSGHRLSKEQALTRKKYAKCACEWRGTWQSPQVQTMVADSCSQSPKTVKSSKIAHFVFKCNKEDYLSLSLLRLSMLLSTNTTNQRGFRAVQEVKAKNGVGKPPSLDKEYYRARAWADVAPWLVGRGLGPFCLTYVYLVNTIILSFLHASVMGLREHTHLFYSFRN